MIHGGGVSHSDAESPTQRGNKETARHPVAFNSTTRRKTMFVKGILKSFSIIAGFVALGFAAAWLFAASPAECVWCPDYGCYSRCNAHCACVSQGFGPGTCVSIQHSERLIAEGWQELK